MHILHSAVDTLQANIDFFPLFFFLLLCLQKDKKYTIFAECNVGNFALNTQYMSYFNIFLMVKMEHVSKITMLGLKRMVKSGLEICILKLTEPLQRYLLSCQANSAILGRYFCTGQQQL